MRLKSTGCAILAAILLLGVRTASAVDFYPISSVSTNTVNFFSKENLIQGPGVGFQATAPFNAIGSATWVTDAFFPTYYAARPAPVITLDLGANVLLNEISTWGYAATNANGVRDFSLRFATAAEGTGGFGTSITYNPLFTMGIDPLPRQSFAFSAPVTARYVELTAINNYAGLGQPGGDRVGMGEIAFEAPPPAPLAGTGIIKPLLLSSTNANPFSVATPAKMIDNSGMTPAVNTGDSLASALTATHIFGGFEQSWVTNASGSDYFAGGTPAPEFIFDLQTDIVLDAVLLWNYQNDGGGNPDGAGFRVGNQARTVELQFNTEAEGSASFDGPVTTVFLSPEFAAPNDAQGLGLATTGRYVKMRVVDNHFGDPDGFGVHPTIGGDRVGLGEVRFHGTPVPEPGTMTLVALGAAAMGFGAWRRKLRNT